MRLAVFCSGGGSNLQAMLDRFQTRAEAHVDIALVVADRQDCGAVDRARAAGLDLEVVAPSGDAARDADRMLELLESRWIGLVALAGYVRHVPDRVVQLYEGRILNIHPALLPAFGGQGMYGMRVHRAVLDSGARVTGATVHYVNEVYDTGRIISQWPVPVLDGDTPQSLARRVLRVEHMLYPATIEMLARGVHTSTAAHGAFAAHAAEAPRETEIRNYLGLD